MTTTLPFTAKLFFSQEFISDHIARNNAAVVPLNTDAEAWLNANAKGAWHGERSDDRRTINTPVEFLYTFAEDRDATLFKMFVDGAS